MKFLITVIPTSAMILYQNAGVGKCLTNIWLHKEMNHIAVQSKCMGLAGYGLVHHHKSDGLESEVVKRLELILCKTHQNRICKDLGCWILYPCYSMFFTHTNSNWLQGTKHFDYNSYKHTIFKYTNTTQKKQLFTSQFWQQIAICMHFRCQGRCVQWTGHVLGRGYHAPDSEGGADSWCAMPPAHSMDAGVGWSRLLRPHPKQWCGHCWWHVQQQQKLKSWHFWEPVCAPWAQTG